MPTNKSFSTSIKKNPLRFKAFPKFFRKGCTSFRKAWTGLANSNLLEESCVKIPTSDSLVWSASSSPSFSNVQFHHSPFESPSSDCDFVRGIPCPSSTNSRVVEEESEDEDSVFSPNSEELILEEELCIEEEELQSGEAENIDSFGAEFASS
uniref:Uncharacterized protein n=1 Tax=Cucumis melo TaxID=3656 RepID=A0A9I9DXH8_CUCME